MEFHQHSSWPAGAGADARRRREVLPKRRPRTASREIAHRLAPCGHIKPLRTGATRGMKHTLLATRSRPGGGEASAGGFGLLQLLRAAATKGMKPLPPARPGSVAANRDDGTRASRGDMRRLKLHRRSPRPARAAPAPPAKPEARRREIQIQDLAALWGHGDKRDEALHSAPPLSYVAESRDGGSRTRDHCGQKELHRRSP